MQITEMLITGYDGKKPVLAINLVSGAATVVLTEAGQENEAVVESAWHEATDIFTSVRDLLEELVRVPAATHA